MKKAQEIKYELTWFEKQSDAFIGKCLIDEISLSELQKLFRQPPEEVMVYCYPVLSSHVEYLQKFVKHQINLKLYDYFIEPYSS